MSDLRSAAIAALEALEQLQGGCTDSDDGTVEAITVWCPEVVDALRTALAEQPEPDRSTWRCDWVGCPHGSECVHAREPVPEPCCQSFSVCTRACTPRGEWLAQGRASEPVRLTEDELTDLYTTAWTGDPSIDSVAWHKTLMHICRTVEAAVLKNMGVSDE